MINEAIEFVLSSVHEPALAHPDLPQAIKNKIISNRTMIRNFSKVGELFIYMQRFDADDKAAGDDVFNALAENNLESLETIIDEFGERFQYQLNDYLMLSDFVIGHVYSSFDIAIFSKKYNVQQGIYPIGRAPGYEAVFIKVTLGGEGEYPNEWIKEGEELKYFLKSRLDVFKTSYVENQAIINANNYPVYVFIKTGTDCLLEGIYAFSETVREESGSIWVKLKKRSDLASETHITQEAFEKQLERKVDASSKGSKDDRDKRLKNASRKPRRQIIKVVGFQRNPDVISKVLERAEGVCEGCEQDAPFIGFAKQAPYLEVHHKKRLADDGDDTVDNAIALCPDCHRERHFGINFRT